MLDELDFNPGSDGGDPLLEANKHLFKLLQGNKKFKLGSFEEFQSYKDNSPDGSLFTWVSSDPQERETAYDFVADTFGFPRYPIHAPESASTAQSQVLWTAYRQRYGTPPSDNTGINGAPWLPISAVGPLLVMGHFNPFCTDFGGVPEGLIIKVLVSAEIYPALLSSARERNGHYPPVYPTVPDTYEPVSMGTPYSEIVRHLVQYGHMDDEFKHKLLKLADGLSTEEEFQENLPHGYYPALLKLSENIGVMPVGDLTIPMEVLQSLPNDICDRYNSIPFAVGPDIIYIATSQIYNHEFEDYIYNRVDSSRKMRRFYSDASDIQKALELAKSKSNTDLTGLAASATTQLINVEQQTLVRLDDSILIEEGTEEQAVERIVYRLLYSGVMKKASDIHIEQHLDTVRVRYRIDGTLVALQTLPIALLARLVTKIKLISRLDIAEQRKPQDGRMSLIIKNRQVDFRISVLPVRGGHEKITIRIIDKSASIKSLNDLRLPPNQMDIVNEALGQDKGLILVTGPTGSGKSSTLYAFLNKLNDGTMNVQTCEDPVEQDLEGVNQFQVP